MTAVIIHFVKNKIHALASQVYILATGLQNAAPPGTTGKSIQYLMVTAADLEQVSANLGNDKDPSLTHLLALLHHVIERDEALRKKYEIKDKFRFVRDRLNEIVIHLENQQSAPLSAKSEEQVKIQEGEVAVYVYLYNAKGALLRSWIPMLASNVFYEYSVNRPIYAEQADIEAMLRAKTDKQQHAYLVIAVKSTDIVQMAGESMQKDSLGNPLVKVKEGSLKLQRLIMFTHNGNNYRLNAEGEFIPLL